MSSYSKLIIFIVVLILVSFVVISMESSIDNINRVMPKINEGVVNGDKYYNESVELLNNKNFNDAMSKANLANDNYNNSLNELSKIQNNYGNDLNDIQRDYINTVVNELKLKLKAVEKLKLSIEYLTMESNNTGSSYGFEANDFINKSLSYQHKRNNIVLDNQRLFK